MTDETRRGRTLRVAAGVLFLLACVVAVSLLEGLFERRDLTRAAHLVQGFRDAAGRSIDDRLRARHRAEIAGEPVFELSIRSKLQGAVRVQATVPLDHAAAGAIYTFDVDVVSGAIHPADEAASDVLRQMRHAAPAADAGNGPPPDSFAGAGAAEEPTGKERRTRPYETEALARPRGWPRRPPASP